MFALLIVVALVGYQTIAYFTAEGTTKNTITTGSLDIELFNLAIDENGETGALETEITHILPGDTCSQMPYVKNTGTEAFYARVNLSSKITKNEEEMPNILVFNINKEKWKLDEDGWYRYVDIIEPGETVPHPLFTEVHFPGVEMNNSYVGTTSTVSIKAQAVQAEYNEHADVLDVQGWPLEGGSI